MSPVRSVSPSASLWSSRPTERISPARSSGARRSGSACGSGERSAFDRRALRARLSGTTGGGLGAQSPRLDLTQPARQNLVDPASVEIDHLDMPAGEVEGIA